MISLCELFLDPFYRSISGFFVLIEKDWLSFGHRFGMRHATDGKESSDRAPIFHQFIECVWQLLQMFPSMFEFNEQLLLDILDEVYSCRFGTFLFDCEKERLDAELGTKTSSLWPFLLSKRASFLNHFYEPATAKVFIPAPQQVSRRLKFWDAYYLRFNDPLVLAQNMWTLPRPSAPIASSPSAVRLNRTKTESTVAVRTTHSPSVSLPKPATKTRRRSKSTVTEPVEEFVERSEKKSKSKEKEEESESSEKGGKTK